jgi:uncharacterized protein (DUF427 family)
MATFNMWKYSGQQRPEFATELGPGQESVWDYTRPPALVDCTQLIEIKAHTQIIARSTRCRRVLETASPPTIYIPPEDIDIGLLVRIAGNSYCEWKGAADYWELADTTSAPAIAWSYPDPKPAFATIRDWLCFYPGRVECTIDGERVRPQEGGFYGGWVTDNIVGPWKGGPDTSHW